MSEIESMNSCKIVLPCFSDEQYPRLRLVEELTEDDEGPPCGRRHLLPLGSVGLSLTDIAGITGFDRKGGPQMAHPARTAPLRATGRLSLASSIPTSLSSTSA